jgi:hypothetical protein
MVLESSGEAWSRDGVMPENAVYKCLQCGLIIERRTVGDTIISVWRRKKECVPTALSE